MSGDDAERHGDKLVAESPSKSAGHVGHHHARVDAEVSGVRCIELNKVGCPGNLVAVEFAPNGREWPVLGEYGGGRLEMFG